VARVGITQRLAATAKWRTKTSDVTEAALAADPPSALLWRDRKVPRAARLLVGIYAVRRHKR